MQLTPGEYRRSSGGYDVFIPAPLPPALKLGRATLAAIEEATHLLGQVEMSRALLPNPELLIYGSLQREAIASSTIEGTVASPDELVLFQAVQREDTAAVREVANYAASLRWGIEQLASLPIASRLILGLHERLMSGVRGGSTAGSYRTSQNYIAPNRGVPIERALYVPPPPEMVQDLMGDLERYINSEQGEPRLVQCALAHYQFETIHPFGDGNGRVGRLIILLQLVQLGLLSAPLIHPSVYFEQSRGQYYWLLQDVRASGAWEDWIAYFVEGIAAQCRESVAFARRVLELQSALKAGIASLRRRAAAGAVLDAFLSIPVMPVSQIRDVTGLATNTVLAALEELQANGIVREMTGRQRGRVYACIAVLDAVFRTAGSDGN